jgi:hypothetical protein
MYDIVQTRVLDYHTAGVYFYFMADIFNRVDEALLAKVELFGDDNLLSVRVTEEGASALFTFLEKDRAIEYAETQVRRLGLSGITYG